MLGSSDILGLILTMRNDDLAPIGTVLRYQLASTANNQFSRQPDFVVDLEPVFGKSASPEALLSNGFQPSLAGQKAIATAVVESLTA